MTTVNRLGVLETQFARQPNTSVFVTKASSLDNFLCRLSRVLSLKSRYLLLLLLLSNEHNKFIESKAICFTANLPLCSFKSTAFRRFVWE